MWFTVKDSDEVLLVASDTADFAGTFSPTLYTQAFQAELPQEIQNQTWSQEPVE